MKAGDRPEAESPGGVAERLREALEGVSLASLASACGVSKETVRRCKSGQAAPASVLIGVCAELGIRADWLLLGRGPKHTQDERGWHLNGASSRELLEVLAERMETIDARLDQLSSRYTDLCKNLPEKSARINSEIKALGARVGCR